MPVALVEEKITLCLIGGGGWETSTNFYGNGWFFMRWIHGRKILPDVSRRCTRRRRPGTGMGTIFLTVVMGFAVLTAGCRPFAAPPPAPDAAVVPEAFSVDSGPVDASGPWWEAFGDDELGGLINAALAGYLPLDSAWARLRQARAQAVLAGAGRYPSVSGTADALAGRRWADTETGFEEYSLGAAANYEVDLWGRVRAGHEASRLRVSASRQDAMTMTLTVSAEVALRWIGIVSQHKQKSLLGQQLALNRTLLELVDLRFRQGIASALDVYQQKQAVDQVRAEMPLVEEAAQLLGHELSVLLGDAPGGKAVVLRTDFPPLPPLPKTGVPADLLRNRPDIRAAWFRLAAAGLDVEAARADRMPALRLTGIAETGAEGLAGLFDNWLASLAAGLVAPAVDGGSRAAAVHRTRAVAEERLADYRQVVITAVKEVEDALVTEVRQKEHITALQQVIATARNALAQAAYRYRNGLTDYLPVLTQLSTVQALERELIRRQTALYQARIQLYRALGGARPDASGA